MGTKTTFFVEDNFHVLPKLPVTLKTPSSIMDDTDGDNKDKGNLVIELYDDDDDVNDDVNDDDCVVVKKEKSLTPSGENMKDPILVDGYCLKNKSIQNPQRKINFDVNSVFCVDNYGDNIEYNNGNSNIGDDDDDDVMIIGFNPSSKKERLVPYRSVTEVGESSGSKTCVYDDVVEVEPVKMTFFCEICADSKPHKESFKIKGCFHSYCYDCMRNYVASKLHDGVTKIVCPVPGCDGILEPEYCREILPFEVFDRWGKLLCESVILASQKFYCPFKDCSALLVDDGCEVVTQSECPSCFRLFCAQCKCPWHDGIVCGEYQKLSKDERQKEDIMLKNLAKNQNWQRCPTCKYYVEKSEGCLYMKCRCGVAFCYKCGSIHTDHMYHYCKKCGR